MMRQGSADVPDVSILIVTYNSKAVLAACLDSIARGARSSHEIILVDNASQDGTPDLVRGRYPKVCLIANSRNTGFAAAVNQAARVAHGVLLLLLNPDTVIHPGALDDLVSCMEAYPSAGICAPRTLRPDGSLRYTCFAFYTLKDLVWDALARGPLQVLRRFKRTLRWNPAVDRIQPVEAAVGAALLIRAEVFRLLDGLDERFFLYCEDADFCLRTHQAGHSVLYTPRAVISHHGGHSIPSDAICFDAMLGRHLLESYYIYLCKHSGRPAAHILRLVNGFMAGFYGLTALLVQKADTRSQYRGRARLLLLTPVPPDTQRVEKHR